MTQEDVRQRIQYLVEHGGIHPEHAETPPWKKAAWVAATVVAVILVVAVDHIVSR